MRQLPLSLRIPDRAVFESFLPGPNAQVLKQLQQLAWEEVAGGGCTWLCGPPGSGKTHLLQATCAVASRAGPAGYLPLAELAALGPGVLEGMQLPCLCLDDLDRVLGQPEWERALFVLWHEIQDAQGRLLVAAAVPPARLTFALPDLASRFGASNILQLRALDESEQQEALQLRARVRGVELPAEVSRWLQRHFPRDMHRLYALLDTLDEAALVEQRRLTVPFIRQVLGL
jgi:DnaA family protein